MTGRYVPVNVAKLEDMKSAWERVVSDRGLVLAKVRGRLADLVARDENATVGVRQAMEFFDAILEFGKAGGHVEALDELVRSLAGAGGVRGGRDTEDTGHHEGDFRLG